MSTTELADFRRSLLQHLADGDLLAVLAALKKSLPEQSAKWNTVCLTETRLNQLSKDKLRGVLSREVSEVSHNQIAANLLDLLNSLEVADFAPTTATSNVHQQGRILYRVPHTMQVEEDHRCVVRLAFDEASILQGIEMTEDTVLKPIRVSEIMEVELIDPNEAPAFRIRSFIDAEQLIVPDDHTEWLFWVKPLRTGELPLMLKVAVKEMIGDRERRRDIVLEELIRVVAEPSVETEEIGFQNAGYTVSYSMLLVKPVASASNYRRPLMALAALVAVVGIWAAVRMEWFASPPVPAKPDPVLQKDSADWQQALLLGADSNFKFYLSQHPEGLYKAWAQAKLDSLLKVPQDTTFDNPEKTGKPKPLTPKTTEAGKRRSGFTTVEVAGGRYEMGRGGKCPKKVSVASFKIGVYEVTQADWEEVMQDGHRSFHIGCADCPVEQVTWQAVQDFLSKASRQRHKKYRLPTEAEWEYAASGGRKSKGYQYAGSDDEEEVAVWDGKNAKVGASSVGAKQPNELNIFDLSGNVREWCDQVLTWMPNCKDQLNSDIRVLRGGAWRGTKKELLLSTRTEVNVKKDRTSDGRTGLRLVEE